MSVGYRLDRYTLFDIPDTASRAYKEYEGKNLSSVVSTSITYDSTDSRERPTSGVVGRVSMEYGGGGIGGNDNFFKPIGELQSFHTLFRNPNHIFHWRGRVGGVFENSNKPVPVFDRFFIGGIDSIRGYDSEDLAPRDPKYHDEIGGDRMGFLNFEYIWTFHPEWASPRAVLRHRLQHRLQADFRSLQRPEEVGRPRTALAFAHGRPALRLRLPAGQERPRVTAPADGSSSPWVRFF
mgnify:CR=1 FL=1